MDQQLQDMRRQQLVRLQSKIQQYLDNTGIQLPFDPAAVEFRSDKLAEQEIRDSYMLRLRWGIGENGRRAILVEVMEDESGQPLRAPIQFDQDPSITASQLRAALRS